MKSGSNTSKRKETGSRNEKNDSNYFFTAVNHSYRFESTKTTPFYSTIIISDPAPKKCKT